MTNTETLQMTTPSEREVVLVRTFDAPRDLVFDALTTAELLKRWLPANGRSMEICEIDLKAGGAYRFVWRAPGRRDVGMHGIHREVVRPSRLVRTELWEDWDAGETVSTTVLVEVVGKTTLTTTVVFPSQEVRDEVIKSGMARGAGESYDKLAEVLATKK